MRSARSISPTRDNSFRSNARNSTTGPDDSPLLIDDQPFRSRSVERDGIPGPDDALGGDVGVDAGTGPGAQAWDLPAVVAGDGAERAPVLGQVALGERGHDAAHRQHGHAGACGVAEA